MGGPQDGGDQVNVLICQPDFVHSHPNSIKMRNAASVLQLIELCKSRGHQHIIVDLNICGKLNSFDSNEFKKEFRNKCREADICVAVHPYAWTTQSARSFCYTRKNKHFLRLSEYANDWLYSISIDGEVK